MDNFLKASVHVEHVLRTAELPERVIDLSINLIRELNVTDRLL